MSNKTEDPEEFVYECKDHIDSDNDSDETIEPTKEPEEPEPEPEPEPPKKRGRKRPSDEEKTERKLARDKLKAQTDNQITEKVIVMTEQPSSINDIGKLSKNELVRVRLVRNNELSKVDDTKKVVTRTGITVVKVKKQRSDLQKAATARLVEANRLRKIARNKAKAEEEEIKMSDMEEHIKTSIKDTIVDVINKPARSLTPERMAKVKKLEKVEVEKYGFFG